MRHRQLLPAGGWAIFALVAVALPLRAAPPEAFVVELPSAINGEKGINPPDEIVFSRTKGLDDQGLNRTVRNISIPTLTVYPAETPAHGKAAVVICPGGGYGSVVIDREGHAVARWMRSQGITAAVLKYRLPDKSTFEDGLPVSQQDALEALRFMKSRSAEWGFSKNRVGIIGFSAGGHLAGSTAVFSGAEDGSRPDFVALLYPVVLMKGESMHKGSRENLIGLTPTPGRIAEFSLERRTTAAMPPFFLFHAEDDSAVPVENSRALAKALRKKGVPAELHVSPTGRHGFALGRDKESSRWPELFLKWLDTSVPNPDQ